MKLQNIRPYMHWKLSRNYGLYMHCVMSSCQGNKYLKVINTWRNSSNAHLFAQKIEGCLAHDSFLTNLPPADLLTPVRLQNLPWYKTGLVSRQVLYLLSKLQNWIWPKTGQILRLKPRYGLLNLNPDSHTFPLRQLKYLFKIKRQS